jgi:hypothetical protein
MRVPSRFNAQASFILLAYAAIATDRIVALVPKLADRVPRLPRAAVPVLQAIVPMFAILGAGDVLGHGLNLAHEYPTGAPMRAGIRPTPRIFYGGADSVGYIEQPQQNRGRLACYEPWAPYEGAPLWEGDLPQAKGTTPGIVVSNVTRTQNTFELDVQADAPGRVLLNSSFDLNWRASVGTPVEQNKQLALDVPAGVHHVRMYYRPRLLILGALVTAASIAAVVWFLRRKRA